MLMSRVTIGLVIHCPGEPSREDGPNVRGHVRVENKARLVHPWGGSKVKLFALRRRGMVMTLTETRCRRAWMGGLRTGINEISSLLRRSLRRGCTRNAKLPLASVMIERVRVRDKTLIHAGNSLVIRRARTVQQDSPSSFNDPPGSQTQLYRLETSGENGRDRPLCGKVSAMPPCSLGKVEAYTYIIGQQCNRFPGCVISYSNHCPRIQNQ